MGFLCEILFCISWSGQHLFNDTCEKHVCGSVGESL